MSESKHTPGPWSTGALRTSVEVWPAGWNVPIRIADCHSHNAPKTGAERVANARLIAAAPELLEACRAAIQVGFWGHHPGNGTEGEDVQAVVDQLHAAIAKATAAE